MKSSYRLAVLLPVSASSFVSPQLQTNHGTDQINDHGDKQEDDGCGLARLRSAERPVDAVVEDRVGAESSAGRVPDINDACKHKKKYVMITYRWFWSLLYLKGQCFVYNPSPHPLLSRVKDKLQTAGVHVIEIDLQILTNK